MFRLVFYCIIIGQAFTQLEKCSYECSLKVRKSINHCSNEDGRFDCVIDELNDDSCLKCLCLGIRSTKHQESCFEKEEDIKDYAYKIRFDTILSKFSSAVNQIPSKKEEEEESIVDLNKGLLECPPATLQTCQSKIKIAIPFCTLSPTTECLLMLIGDQCKNCVCKAIDCTKDLSFESIVSLYQQQDKVPSLLGQLATFFESNQDKIKQTTDMVTQNQDQLYSVPIYLWSIRNDVRSSIVKGYENVSQFAFEKYCEGVITKAKMTCLSGRNSKPNQGYFNCIMSLISESSCQPLICEKQRELC